MWNLNAFPQCKRREKYFSKAGNLNLLNKHESIINLCGETRLSMESRKRKFPFCLLLRPSFIYFSSFQFYVMLFLYIFSFSLKEAPIESGLKFNLYLVHMSFIHQLSSLVLSFEDSTSGNTTKPNMSHSFVRRAEGERTRFWQNSTRERRYFESSPPLCVINFWRALSFKIRHLSFRLRLLKPGQNTD